MSKKQETESAELKEAAAIIAEQNDLINKLAAGKAAGGNNSPLIQIDGESYLIQSGGNFKGKHLSKKEISEDADLVKLLIKIGSSIVKKEG